MNRTDIEWWCPSEQRWTMCPGPCPDGARHRPIRLRPEDRGDRC